MHYAATIWLIHKGPEQGTPLLLTQNSIWVNKSIYLFFFLNHPFKEKGQSLRKRKVTVGSTYLYHCPFMGTNSHYDLWEMAMELVEGHHQFMPPGLPQYRTS